MTAPAYTIRRFGPDGTVISEVRMDAKALQAQFDAEGYAAKVRKLRQRIPDEPSIAAGFALLAAICGVAVLGIVAFSGAM